MERSRKIFRKIVSAARQVVAIANDYADHQDSNKVSRYHFQLEDDMRRISVTCECLASVLDKPLSERGPVVDIRVQDWISTDEPQECLDTLSRMERLLQRDVPSRMPSMSRTGRGSTVVQDKIKEASDLFNSSKGCFHFLFSTEIWDSEKGVQKQQDVPRCHPETITTARETVNYQDRHAAPQGSHELKRETGERKLEEILTWLDGLNCAEKQDVTMSLRQEDTCEWLFDTTQYRMWRRAESGSLWLRGKPGAGKSVLVSFVIDSFKKARREGDIFTFFYCDFRNERSTSSAEALRSILSQLLRQLRGQPVDLGDVLNDLTEAKEWGGNTLSNAMELAGFVSRAARLLTKKPLVIVDALDECKDVQKLIQALKAISDHVCLFIASRPLRVIMDELSDLPFVSMEDMADELSMDIELHVTRELDVRRRLRDLDSVLKMKIRTVLCDRANGMFRWVQCSIDTLDRCVTRKEVRDALHDLPTGLDETYERILLAIDMETLAGRLAQRALSWLVVALRPLLLSEVMEALSINLQTRTLDLDIGPMHSGALLDACGSLVTYTERTGVIILSHFSVKEYLMAKCTRTNLQPYHVNPEHSHLLLVRSCMCYISICLKRIQGPALVDVSSSGSIGISSQPMVRLHPKLYPLLDYALDDALGHFERLGSAFESALSDVAVLAKDIQRHSWAWDNVCIPARWSRWKVETIKPRWPAAVHDLLLYILVAFASNSFMNAYLRRAALKPKDGTNPLVYAAYFDNDQHARTLLSLGARTTHRGWEIDRYRQSLPIEVAFHHQHYTMVTYFMEEGSPIPPHIFIDSFSLDQPHFFFHSLKVPLFTARALMRADEFVENMNNCFMETLYQWIMDDITDRRSGITEQDLIIFARRFIQVADEHSTVDSARQAFFRLAVSQGYLSAAQYLLTLGTLPPRDILTHLGLWKTVPMILLLVENGADVLVRTQCGDSILHTVLWAQNRWFHSANNDADDGDVLEVTKLLVDLGCDPFGADSHGKAPLRIAVERGYTSVARYLITLGAHVPPDFLVTLPRHGRWWRRMIRLLVENGANALAYTSDGDSLLHVISRSFHGDDETLEAARVLVGYGCDPLQADSRGKTPLHLAVEHYHTAVARYLITLGTHLPPDFFATLRNGNDSWWKHYSIAPMIRLLAETGENLLVRTDDEKSLLHVALQFSHDENQALEVARVLVRYGCNPLEADSHGYTPLQIAVTRHHISVAQYLLTLGANPPPDFLATSEIRQCQSASMIRLLVENGANVLMHTSDGDPLLHAMLQSLNNDDEALEVARVLVGYGCDPLETNARGKTTLHIAVERYHISVARYLITLGVHPPVDILRAVTLGHDLYHRRMAPMIRLLVENGANALVHTDDGGSLLHLVLQSLHGDSDFEVIRLLVGYGCDPFEADSHGNTPLQVAVEYGYTSVARYLLALGAYLPLDFLVLLGRQKWVYSKAPMIHLLVEYGANALAHTSDGDSLLHVAIRSSQGPDDEDVLDAARILVGYGCDPLKANVHGETPLHIAVEQEHISVARYLLTLGAHPSPDFLVTFGHHWWECCSKSFVIRLLVENGASALARTSGGDSLLHVMLQSLWDGDEALKAAKVLVGYGCDPLEVDSRGKAPLQIAVERGFTSVAQYLLVLGAHPPPDILVISECNWKKGSIMTAPMIRLLVENGANALARTGNGDSLLCVMLRSSLASDDNIALQATRVLVGYGCDPLDTNSCGETPLHIAAGQGHISVARYLISRGASVLTKACNGDTVLHFAAHGGGCSSSDGPKDYYALKAIQFFLEHGCDPAVSNDSGRTPLHIAVDHGSFEIMEYLLSLNISPPHDILFTAIQSDHIKCGCGCRIVKTLVGTSGCDTQICNSDGDTPLQAAIKKGKVHVVEYLLSVVSLDNPSLEDLLSAVALAPLSVQSQIRCMVTDRRTRSESPELPAAKRVKHS